MSYNPSIPQPGDNISVSQGQMLTNFSLLDAVFTAGSTTGSTGGNIIGYQLANGLIINFTTALVTFSSAGTVYTFQTTYPYTTAYVVSAIAEGASPGAVLSVVNTNLLTFTGYSTIASANCYFVVIGY